MSSKYAAALAVVEAVNRDCSRDPSRVDVSRQWINGVMNAAAAFDAAPDVDFSPVLREGAEMKDLTREDVRRWTEVVSLSDGPRTVRMLAAQLLRTMDALAALEEVQP